MNATINSENRGAWQSLANTVSASRPSVGRSVTVTRGKHKGATGTVTWHGRDRYSDAFRYGSDSSHALREMAGQYGYRVRVQPQEGEAFYCRADYVEVIA